MNIKEPKTLRVRWIIELGFLVSRVFQVWNRKISIFRLISLLCCIKYLTWICSITVICFPFVSYKWQNAISLYSYVLCSCIQWHTKVFYSQKNSRLAYILNVQAFTGAVTYQLHLSILVLGYITYCKIVIYM